MGKDNKLLWVIAAAGAGWLLAPKEVKEQITGGVPSIGIDLSGLLGGGVGQAPLGEGGLLPEGWSGLLANLTKLTTLGEGGILPEFDIPELEFPPFPEDWIPNIPEFAFPKFEWPAFPEIPSLIPPILPTPPTPPPAIPSPWEEFTKLDPITKNVLAGVAGVGGVYGAVKGIQAVAPATRIATDAMARTFAAVLRGKPPVGGVPAVKPPIIPKWGKTPLGKQWISKTSLGKVFGGGQAGRITAGALGKTTLAALLTIPAWEAAKWLNYAVGGGTSGVTNFLDQFLGISTLPARAAGIEPSDVTIPWTSEMWNMKPQPEDAYTRKEPVPMRAEREYVPKETKPKPSYHEPKPTPKKYTTDLYKPALEGVQW